MVWSRLGQRSHAELGSSVFVASMLHFLFLENEKTKLF